MAYTVKELANISGVSVRTLHWYDKKGLLQPSYYGNNGYRYYEEPELLILQQILFFRELGLSLNTIKKCLTQDNFDKAQTLKIHKKVLSKEIERKQQLIKTIDKTILHLGGEKIMSDKEMYDGFDHSKQKEYETYIIKTYGTEGESRLEQSKKRTAHWSKEEWDAVKTNGHKIHKDLAKAIENGLPPTNRDVQEIIDRHYEQQSKFFDITKEVYIGLADLYATHPDFRKVFEKYHTEMVSYIGKAIKHYAEHNL